MAKTESVSTSTNTVAPQTSTPVQKTAPTAPVYIPRPNSISISAPIIVSEPENSFISNTVEKPKNLNNPFTNIELENGWKRFADTIPEQGRITSFILSNTPHLTSETNFEVTVSNSLQQKELARLQPDILAFLHIQLQNSLLKMTIKIMEETETQRASSPEDRYKLLMEQNSALKTLRDGLNLEID